MKKLFIVNFPEKSIFGFKILTSLQSSIFCYLILLIGEILNSFFGDSNIQIIAGTLFNLLLNISIVILIINIYIRRLQIKKIYFIFLNLGLFIYLPIAFYKILSNSIHIITFLKF